jgi:hypothetical protein
MAYETTNVPSLISQRVGASGGAVWIYTDGDPVSTVCGVNYLSNATALGLKAGDKVIHVDTTLNTTTDLRVMTGETPGTAVGALCSAIEPATETSIALDSAGTGTFLINDIVRFSNDPTSEYRITTGDTDISNGGALVITPGLAVATAIGTGISIKSDVINLSAGKTGSQVISGSGATRTLTAQESGATVLFDLATGITYTLPTAVVGLKYKFITTVNRCRARSRARRPGRPTSPTAPPTSASRQTRPPPVA